MTDAWKRRLIALAALLVAGGALGFVSMSNMGEDLVYYWSPSELLAHDKATDATVRLGGMVMAGSFEWDQDAHRTSFTVTDNAKQVPVEIEGNPPQMFREGIGVVIEGQLGADGVFRSDRVMVKHSNEYEAPEDGAMPPHPAKTLVAEDDS